MKQLFTIIAALLLHCSIANAQAYTVLADTLNISALPLPTINNSFDSIVIGSSPVTYGWKVIYCNFPPDWISGAAICDNVVCRELSGLWPSGMQDTTVPYLAADTAVLKLALALPAGSTTGCYYLTARLYDTAVAADSITETWGACNYTTAVPVVGNTGNLVLYPNPAQDKVYLDHDAALGIAQAEIYNATGQKIRAAMCANGHAAITVSDLPAGIYFVRCTDKRGAVIAVRDFIKN